MKYKALVKLRYPDGPAEQRKRSAGQECAWKVVEVGEVVDDIPRKSISWLLEQGKIEEMGGEDNRKVWE